MTDQLDLFSTGQLRGHRDPVAATRARDEALDRVGAGQPDLAATLQTTVLDVAQQQSDFTSDDVWAALGDDAEAVAEPRVLGAVIRSLARGRRITATGDYRNSTRPACHARPVKVWRLTEELN